MKIIDKVQVGKLKSYDIFKSEDNYFVIYNVYSNGVIAHKIRLCDNILDSYGSYMFNLATIVELTDSKFGIVKR